MEYGSEEDLFQKLQEQLKRVNTLPFNVIKIDGLYEIRKEKWEDEALNGAKERTWSAETNKATGKPEEIVKSINQDNIKNEIVWGHLGGAVS